jgi:hypothetical protein
MPEVYSYLLAYSYESIFTAVEGEEFFKPLPLAQALATRTV